MVLMKPTEFWSHVLCCIIVAIAESCKSSLQYLFQFSIFIQQTTPKHSSIKVQPFFYAHDSVGQKCRPAPQMGWLHDWTWLCQLRRSHVPGRLLGSSVLFHITSTEAGMSKMALSFTLRVPGLMWLEQLGLAGHLSLFCLSVSQCSQHGLPRSIGISVQPNFLEWLTSLRGSVLRNLGRSCKTSSDVASEVRVSLTSFTHWWSSKSLRPALIQQRRIRHHLQEREQQRICCHL